MNETGTALKNIRNHPSFRISQCVVGVIFLINISCAVTFIFQPESYMGGFEVDGVAGRVLVQALGILFLMWNATYPLVMIDPFKNKTLFAVVLSQQALGVIGESWLYLTLPAGHAALRATGLRFIYFDGFGLILMGMAYFYFSKRISSLSDK